MATHDERDPARRLLGSVAGVLEATDAIRPPAPTRLTECPELATGTVLHVHHSPV